MGAVAEAAVPLQQNDAAQGPANATGGHRNEGRAYRDAFCNLHFK